MGLRLSLFVTNAPPDIRLILILNVFYIKQEYMAQITIQLKSNDMVYRICLKCGIVDNSWVSTSCSKCGYVYYVNEEKY